MDTKLPEIVIDLLFGRVKLEADPEHEEALKDRYKLANMLHICRHAINFNELTDYQYIYVTNTFGARGIKWLNRMSESKVGRLEARADVLRFAKKSGLKHYRSI